MKYRNSTKKRSNSRIPALAILLGIILVGAAVILTQVGFQRALWEIKSGIDNILSANGPAQSFIDPIFNSQKDENRQKTISFKIGLVSDSHNDTVYYPQILQKIKDEQVDFIFHMGDAVDAGSIADLTAAKQQLEATGIPYYTLCGNHDRNFWPTIEDKNYQTVYGDTYYTFTHKNVRFIAINNSDEFAGIASDQWAWLENNLQENKSKPTFLLMHIPPYHPFLTHTMMSGEDAVQKQAQQLLKLSADYHIDEIISGHLHSFSRYVEPDTDIKITVVGASGTVKNLVPSYAIGTIYTDGSYDIENKVLTDPSDQTENN